MNSSAEDVTDQYAITYQAGTLTVTTGAITLTSDDTTKVYVDVKEDGDKVYLDTNLAEALGSFTASLIDTDVLGKAFEPQQRFEDRDGSDIVFDTDYFGEKRSSIIPGPFASLDLKDKNVVL